ncbi:putative pectinesterase/pectinesterase inhibitor 28 [Senna tora]|uniref:Putative pectinesterase/pectinesterase inhibitor 28 n=1 Tax=Senna tora TaxID=362788 RepID=A0A834X9U6_9FABA|nr:putative pectinesterase/pectinesterase inhibitor 28 [Senna tora]
MHMSSNSLAIINDMAYALASLNLTKQSRRLLHHEDVLTHAGDATVLGHGVHHNLQLPFWMEDGMGARRGLLEGDKHIKEGKLKPDVVSNYSFFSMFEFEFVGASSCTSQLDSMLWLIEVEAD